MEPVEIIQGKVCVLDRADVDTDQIIPKQFLKRVERTGFGEFLFYDWIRDGEIELEPNPILVAGPNFGCGSSREHAPWALQDFGFEAIVAPSFARHLLRQLHQDRAAAGDPRRPTSAGRSPRRARPGSTSTTRRSTRRPAWSGSRSTRRSSTGSSTASTTSGSRCRTWPRSTPSRPPATPTAGRSRPRCERGRRGPRSAGAERRGAGGWERVLDERAPSRRAGRRVALGAVPGRGRAVRARRRRSSSSRTTSATRLVEPRRALIVNFPVRRDSGEVEEMTGYRVQHTLVMGPTKGGIRFAPASRSASAPRWRCG